LSASAGAATLPVNWAGLSHLLVVYATWSSTYLAIRLAVREGAGWPPFTMACARFLVAGLILLAWARLRNGRLGLTRADLAFAAVTGALFMLGGNGLVTWAEQRADSSYAALLVASAPIWVAIMEAALRRTRPSRLLIASLVVGFAGVGVLTAPAFLGGVHLDPLSVAALIAAPILWGVGSVVQHRRAVDQDLYASSGLQQVCGALSLALVALIAREPMPTPTTEAWIAWGYLVVCGSILGFTSFIRTLQLLPSNIAMTYAYVNPVGAVLLGWLVLQEQITPWTLAGAALVLMGVAGVFRARGG
jgi:drug/metabolite transporter (DMT)-like permease